MNYQRKRFLAIFIILVNLCIEERTATDPGDVEKILMAGTKLLAAGQFMDALTQYDKAVDGDPSNYLIYYRRATVFMGMGNTKLAIEDLSSSLLLNPEFSPARSQRANLYMKQGRLQEAKEDINIILKQKPGDTESLQSLNTIEEISVAIESAKKHHMDGNYEEAVKYLDLAIKVTTLNQDLWEMRGNCFLKTGDNQKAIQDFRRSVKLSNDNREGFLRLSRLLYESGHADQSLIEVRECLKLDPDHKACFEHYKMIKKLVQLLNSIQKALKENRYEDCITESKKLILREPSYNNTIVQYLCKCGTKGADVKEAIKSCESAHDTEPTNPEIACDLADAHIANEDFDSAIKYFQKVLEADQIFRRAQEGIRKAQKLLKNSKKRNYYNILGVPRTASKKEILKAYRKLAAEHHPDRYKGTNKKAAERKFIDITEAKEVLSNSEYRQSYDNGDDPLDPEHQHHGPSGNPFGFTFHNFNPFENDGGPQYEFNFR